VPEPWFDELAELEALGLQLWDGTIAEPGLLAFVGEKGRTFILAPAGRGWLPTSRAAEPHPVEARIRLDGADGRFSTRRL